MSGSTLTVPAAVMAAGDVITIHNSASTTLSIVGAAGVTLRLVASTTTGNRVLTARGLVTLIALGASDFLISGAGLG